MCELHLAVVDVESETKAYEQEMQTWKEKVVEANGRRVVPKPIMCRGLVIKSAMERVLRQMTEDDDPLGPLLSDDGGDLFEALRHCDFETNRKKQRIT